jgi:hypothetical protein
LESSKKSSPPYSHSLYKGNLGVAMLAMEIQHPEDARQPLMESIF